MFTTTFGISSSLTTLIGMFAACGAGLSGSAFTSKGYNLCKGRLNSDVGEFADFTLTTALRVSVQPFPGAIVVLGSCARVGTRCLPLELHGANVLS